MNIQNIASKVNMIGGSIIGKNDFAIAYTQNNRVYCIRFKLNGEIDKTLQSRDDIEEVIISDYFVTVLGADNKTTIYNKYKDSGEVFEKGLKIIVPGVNGAHISKGVNRKTKVFLCKTLDSRLYIINYKGKKQKIKFKESNGNGKMLLIMYREADNKYYIGYGWPRYNQTLNGNTVMYLIEKPSNEDDILMTFDSEIDNIKYTRRSSVFNGWYITS